jgi:hypothetical protein
MCLKDISTAKIKVHNQLSTLKRKQRSQTSALTNKEVRIYLTAEKKWDKHSPTENKKKYAFT